jgi:hypothetical protein
MEKTARKPSADPTQERLRQNKAVWNKEVSSFINDLIHFKKMMNGWPSKFYKERTRITQPIPADPATIIGSLAGDFQEISNKGTGLIQEQLEYAKNRRQKQPKPAAPQPGAAPATPQAPTPEAPKPDLTQQLSRQPLAASLEDSGLIRLASDLEAKYELEVVASNPFSRFITRLFNPKFGFGEGARIRRLRMAMLDNCVKSFKELKKLHKEIVKSGKGSIVNSHKMMTLIWNYWNAVNRLFSTYKAIRPNEVVKDEGGQIEEDEELKKEKAAEEGREPGEPAPEQESVPVTGPVVDKMRDFLVAAAYLGTVTKSPTFRELHSAIESVVAAPKNRKLDVVRKTNVDGLYDRALQEVNAELNTSGGSFADVVAQKKSAPIEGKMAQRQLGKLRHQIIPGATSGQRLEIYRFIAQIRKDLDEVMNLLEAGFDQEKLTTAINQVNREMAALRTMIRSLYYSEKPEEASSPFF